MFPYLFHLPLIKYAITPAEHRPSVAGFYAQPFSFYFDSYGGFASEGALGFTDHDLLKLGVGSSLVRFRVSTIYT